MRRGQAMVEYVLALAALMLVVVVMGYLVRAGYRALHRTESMVSSEYP